MQILHVQFVLFIITLLDNAVHQAVTAAVDGAVDANYVLDVADNSFGCTTYVRLARKAGLDKTLFNGKGPFTLFAPSNDAFTPDFLAQLESNSTLLNDVIRFHAIDGVIVTVKDIHKNDYLYPSCLANVSVRTNFYIEGTKVGVYMASGAFLTNGDYKADNGIVHYVINPMYPIPDTNIAKYIETNHTFSILCDVIKSAGMIGPDLFRVLEGGNYTLFAPTNEAFQDMQPGELKKLLSNHTLCWHTILRHMMNGTYYSEGVFDDQPELSSEGTYLHFKHDYQTDDSWQVEGIPVIEGNLSKTNGVLHVVHHLIPEPSMIKNKGCQN
ncbi:transforming growth factor-beta-induced protein ig-h3-like [Amphiura filiformis]|uniref:transforming growth factor-beta-induced protein ig-h3-like n=1 Tax=Amphiura filiformis TaxID=82378 RepID=UPI003B2149EA